MENKELFKALKTPKEISINLNIRDCKLKANVIESVLADIANDGNGRQLRFFALKKSNFKMGPLPKVERLNSKNKKEIEIMISKKNEKFFKKLNKL